MKTKRAKDRNDYETFDRALNRAAEQNFVLRLYVTGATPKSLRAINHIKAICEEHLKGRYQLEIIDIYQQPVLARGEQIIAAPTLIKYLPAPLRKFIGDMADSERILLGLDLRSRNTKAAQGADCEPRRRQNAQAKGS